MNIDDIIQKIDMPDGPVMVTIFQLQEQLMKEYDKIERQNGYIVPEPPYDLDDTKIQARIKDMFWRVTEELAEAVEVVPPLFQLSKWSKFWDTETEVRHFFEELADALHFLVEASIIAGLSPEEVGLVVEHHLLHNTSRTCSDELIVGQAKSLCSEVVYAMGIAANVFKNKPWKLTQMPTDKPKFKAKLTVAWGVFMRLWKILNCNQKQMYMLYAKKNLVNKWRQETNY